MTRLTPRDKTHSARRAARWAVLLFLFVVPVPVSVACADQAEPPKTPSTATGAPGTSAPTPAPTPTPAPPSLAHPAISTTSTGVPIVDRAIRAFAVGDLDDLVAITVPRVVACKTNTSVGDVACRPGDTDGTNYQVKTAATGCSLQHVDYSEARGVWDFALQEAASLWAITREAEHYQLLFTRRLDRIPLMVISVAPEGLSGLFNVCGQSPEEAFPPSTDFLVPPR